MEHPLESRIARRIIASILLIGRAVQGPELTLGKFFGRVLKGAVAAGSHQRADRRRRQDKALFVAQAMAVTRFVQRTETLPEAFQLGGAPRTGTRHFGFVSG